MLVPSEVALNLLIALHKLTSSEHAIPIPIQHNITEIVDHSQQLTTIFSDNLVAQGFNACLRQLYKVGSCLSRFPSACNSSVVILANVCDLVWLGTLD